MDGRIVHGSAASATEMREKKIVHADNILNSKLFFNYDI